MHPSIDAEDPKETLRRAAGYVRHAERVAVLTGAGISAESGLATFRGAGGLWEGQRVEDVATPSAFRRDPALVWRFYNARRKALQSVRPNPGHLALAQLEERFGEGFTLITQNVDGLHRAAGNRRVLELHGNLARVRCTGCGSISDRGQEELDELPHCDGCGELLRPDIVWFHEMLPQDVWLQAETAARRCQCFIIVGTSAIVYPAAGLLILARDHDARAIEVNLEQTPASHHVDVGLRGPAGQMLPQLLDLL
jgi:NAD-dependent deacetylase